MVKYDKLDDKNKLGDKNRDLNLRVEGGGGKNTMVYTKLDFATQNEFMNGKM